MIYLLDLIVIVLGGNESWLWTKTRSTNSMLEFCSKVFLVFAELHEKTNYGLCYKLTLTRGKDHAVLSNAEAITEARRKIDNIQWYVSHYTPSTPQQGWLSKQFLSKNPTALRYSERSVFIKEVNNTNRLTFELSSHVSMNVPTWRIVAFQKRDSHNLKKVFFNKLPITSAQCFIRTESYPDAGTILTYA